MTIALIDGDLVAFRCAASAEGESEGWVATARCDSFIDEILAMTGATEYEVWLSGKDNFRKAVYPEYKGNRKDAYRPKYEADCKDYLKLQHNAQVLDGAEADDALGFRAYEIGERAIVCTNDKDNKQTAGKHYDPVKKEFFSVTDEEATRFFYYQMLVGDPVDNLKGVPGIGPVKANKLLDSVPPEEWYQTVKDNYSCDEEFYMMAKCLHIWKKRGDIYTDSEETLDTGEN